MFHANKKNYILNILSPHKKAYFSTYCFYLNLNFPFYGRIHYYIIVFQSSVSNEKGLFGRQERALYTKPPTTTTQGPLVCVS